MKSIGIKQADGSFYPILEEGVPGKKSLGLITAKDNQTRVIVDIYRSDNGTMEDADYVDSLQIDNLVAHAKGSSEINLKIGLDEEGKLTAELVDPETGAVSNADVTLVTRTLEERLAPSEFDLAAPEEPAETEFADETEESESSENESSGAVAAGAVAGAAAGGLMAAALRQQEKAEPEEEQQETAEEFSEETVESSDATQGETKIDDFDLPDFDMGGPAPLDESSETADAPAEESAPAAADDDFSLPDFGDDTTEKPAEESAPAAADDDFSLPDFGDDTTEKPAEETVSSDDEFDLPDFDTNADTTEASSSDSDFDFNFDSDTESDSSPAEDFSADDIPDEPAPDSTLEMMKHSSALKFDNLYDKETMDGNLESQFC